MPREVEIDIVVPGTPAEVAERLGAHTRFSLTAFQASFILWNDKPLKGRVSARGANVALQQRDLFTRMQPVVTARFSPTAGGTRIQGVAGVPRWLVWYLRGVTALLGIVGVGLAGVALVGGVVSTPLLILLGLLTAAMLFLVGAVGANLNYAADSLDALITTVERAAGATVPTATTPQAVAKPRSTPQRPPAQRN